MASVFRRVRWFHVTAGAENGTEVPVSQQRACELKSAGEKVRREEYGSWLAKYRDASGRRVTEPTAAKTKTEARRLAEDLERRAERVRYGLEAPPAENGGGTLGELLSWWLRTYSAGSPSHSKNESVIKLHLLDGPLSSLPLVAVTPGKVEEFLQAKGTDLGPQSVNHLRGYVSRAFNAARRAGRFHGPNPVADVKKRRVPTRLPDFLREHEVAPVMAQIPEHWRPFYAAAIYTGMRKGELIGLRKCDVDFATRLITVARSYDRDTTKGGHADAIPMADELIPYLKRAVESSASDLVFPNADGGLWSQNVDLEGILRRALARAGIVLAYVHGCRRCKAKGEPYTERQTDKAERRCPHCGMALWPKALVRPIRFHDLRHTAASLMLMRGVSLAAVQRILRHSDPKITAKVYGHLLPDFLRAEVNRLSFGIGPALQETTEAPRAVASGGESGPVGAMVVPWTAMDKERAGTSAENTQKNPALEMARDTGFEPVAFGSGGYVGSNPAPINPHSGSESQQVGHSVTSQSVTALTDVTEPRGAMVVPRLRPALRLLAKDEGRLITVSETAKRLGVCAAVVYRLCRGGCLPFTRVSNAIRISPADLAAYLAGRSRSA